VSQTENSVSDSFFPIDDSTLLSVPKANHPFNLTPHPTIQYADFSSTIHSRSRLQGSSLSDNLIYERVVHPYNTDAFELLLQSHKLTAKYPFLVRSLREGFPIGSMPKLESTVIIPNHSSVQENLDVVYDYIRTEIDADRMSGPFTREVVERILRGPFYASPLIVAVQDQGPGLPSKRRVCRNLSKDDRVSGMSSVNSFIDKKDFPTRFDMAFRVADAVSLSLFEFWWVKILLDSPVFILPYVEIWLDVGAPMWA
jgi:hypothetical protein